MNNSLGSFRARQPGKTLWMAVAVVHVIIRTLFLGLYYIPASKRQNRNWTYRQALTVELFRTSFFHMTSTKLTFGPLSLEPGADGDNFVSIQPQSGIHKGILLQDPAIQPVKVGGTWYPKLFQPGDEQRTVVLHFHGGSFLWGTGRQSDCKVPASTMLGQMSATALFVQYRLASNPNGTFPAALQDAVTAYHYLLGKNIPASNIVLSGDSAGGNIVMALLRYIHTTDGSNLPNPSAALLWSPSVDLGSQCDSDSVDLHRNRQTDYITGFTLVWGVNAYIPKTMKATDPYFSPIQHPFSTPTALWIMVGGSEVLYDSIVGFADSMRGVAGNNVVLYEVPNAPHDIFFVGHLLGWTKSLEGAARAASEFIRDLTPGTKS